MNIENVNHLMAVISKVRLSLEDEKITQLQLEQYLTSNGIKFEREYHLDKKNIVDFYFPEIHTGVEIKIGQITKKEIYKQVVRYCEFEVIHNIILLTNKSMSLPLVINNKNTFILNIGKAWI